MVAIDQENSVFEKLLEDDPSRLYPPRFAARVSPHPIITVVSQPVPNLGLRDDCSNLKIKLADFGSATWTHKHLVEEIQPISLRAPEVVLGHEWGTPVDIWTVGCLVFEFLTARSLFNPVAGRGWTEEHNLLGRHMTNTGQLFPVAMLRQSTRVAKHFDLAELEKDGVTETKDLTNAPSIPLGSLEGALRNYKILNEEDVLDTARFMRRCVALDPARRASAAELLKDGWLK